MVCKVEFMDTHLAGISACQLYDEFLSCSQGFLENNIGFFADQSSYLIKVHYLYNCMINKFYVNSTGSKEQKRIDKILINVNKEFVLGILN